MAENKITRAVREDVLAVSDLLAEGAGLQKRRGEAFERLGAAELPSRVEHLWRFTNPENMLPATLLPDADSATSEHDAASAATIVMSPGSQPLISLQATAEAAGLEVLPLAEGGDAASRLGEAAGGDGYFTTLNDVGWNTGLLVRVPRGTVLNEPVHVIVQSEGEASLPRLLVIADAGAQVTVVEEHRGGDTKTRVVGVTEILADEGSHVRHVVVQAWDDDAHGHLAVHARLARDANLESGFCTLGGRRSKLELVTTLAGEGARSDMVGVTLAGALQHLDHHTRHVHLAGHTSSNIDFKAVAAKRARSSYTGLIRIEKEAREVEAFQENRNLLLSDSSRCDSIPELEILNQDVSCSHGATVAPLDEAQVFYLQSRGISQNWARRLIVRGLVENTLRRLPESLRERVESLVDKRLDRLEDGVS